MILKIETLLEELLHVKGNKIKYSFMAIIDFFPFVTWDEKGFSCAKSLSFLH